MLVAWPAYVLSRYGAASCGGVSEGELLIRDGVTPGIVRIGDTVRRPLPRPFSLTVQAYLAHLRDAGYWVRCAIRETDHPRSRTPTSRTGSRCSQTRTALQPSIAPSSHLWPPTWCAAITRIPAPRPSWTRCSPSCGKMAPRFTCLVPRHGCARWPRRSPPGSSSRARPPDRLGFLGLAGFAQWPSSRPDPHVRAARTGRRAARSRPPRSWAA